LIQQPRARRIMPASLDPVTANLPDAWRSVPLRVDLHDAIPRAEIAGSIESDQMREIFFTTSFEPTLWIFTYRRDDIDDDLAAQILGSIAWLDPIWFAAYPAL
jgi:hypothetical protein